MKYRLLDAVDEWLHRHGLIAVHTPNGSYSQGWRRIFLPICNLRERTYWTDEEFLADLRSRITPTTKEN